MNIRDRDDQLLNPLNNILLLAYDTKQFKEIEKEVRRVVEVLVKERIVAKRNQI